MLLLPVTQPFSSHPLSAPVVSLLNLESCGENSLHSHFRDIKKWTKGPVLKHLKQNRSLWLHNHSEPFPSRNSCLTAPVFQHCKFPIAVQVPLEPLRVRRFNRINAYQVFCINSIWHTDKIGRAVVWVVLLEDSSLVSLPCMARWNTTPGLCRVMCARAALRFKWIVVACLLCSPYLSPCCLWRRWGSCLNTEKSHWGDSHGLPCPPCLLVLVHTHDRGAQIFWRKQKVPWAVARIWPSRETHTWLGGREQYWANAGMQKILQLWGGSGQAEQSMGKSHPPLLISFSFSPSARVLNKK